MVPVTVAKVTASPAVPEAASPPLRIRVPPVPFEPSASMLPVTSKVVASLAANALKVIVEPDLICRDPTPLL